MNATDRSVAPSSRRVAATALTVDERLTAVLFLAAGAVLVYLVLFSEGRPLEALLAAASQQNYLHELFHDGRHFANVPCH